ncbi:MAG TPA: hypothetical protein VL977_01630 [Solirubrobacteraceae bacterium]|nr:hypothetical protein [Solirubrobacteraceae bacterium]
MRGHNLLGVAVAAAAVAGLALSAPAQARGSVECQHPVITGVEVSRLSHVTSATACPVALSLWRWENKPGNAAKLYKCTTTTPVLELKRFDGWSLSVGRAGFKMARSASSFYVSGTDFPIACN